MKCPNCDEDTLETQEYHNTELSMNVTENECSSCGYTERLS